ncbi:unnamed protein product [Urochloa humidicola]
MLMELEYEMFWLMTLQWKSLLVLQTMMSPDVGDVGAPSVSEHVIKRDNNKKISGSEVPLLKHRFSSSSPVEWLLLEMPLNSWG